MHLITYKRTWQDLIESKGISSLIAIQKIDELVSGNIMYSNNAELASEIKKRKDLWGSRLV